ncbi:hypothetical protein KFV08_02635 [Macrococcoides canis]|uniref:hypothetical protein n=1 Tax=Macrococcoides canis TaxID=1855823 RepID=UPI00207C1734|nr:hypothetical protein [Macrococcus canis]MCO4097051.1 hypothetical protein [Macrococcus canis]UTH09691.1 hypothetical protein KFV08_02635 [Macrococcus canis]
MESNLILEVFGGTFLTGIFGVCIYIYNSKKKIVFKNALLSYSKLLTHSFTENVLEYSYGRAELRLDFFNGSKYGKSILNGDINYKISNFKNLDFNDILLDLSFAGNVRNVTNIMEVKTINLYCINNSHNKSQKTVSIQIVAFDKIIKNIKNRVELNDGDIIKFIEIKTDVFKHLYEDEDNQKLLIIIKIDEYEQNYSLEYKNGHFITSIPGGIGSGGAISKENIVDLIVDNNEKNDIRGMIKINPHCQDTLRIKMFSTKSCEYDYSVYLKNKMVFKDKIKVMVPMYNNFNIDNKILFNSYFSEFMHRYSLEKYNIYDKTYDTESLPFYKKEYYFEKEDTI